MTTHPLSFALSALAVGSCGGSEARGPTEPSSSELRHSEPEACLGLAPDDRNTNPFASRQEVASIEPLTETIYLGSYPYEASRTRGARITFRHATADELQKVVTCHVARRAALGKEVPSMRLCPLMARDVEARVVSTGRGSAVEIRSDIPRVADEIVARARLSVRTASR